MTPPRILLATLNARYIHASLGLRYLLANMGELEADTELAEFIITQRPVEIAEAILARAPRIVGFGVYIWNVEETTKVVAILKRVQPELVVVLGGPEVSFEVEDQAITRLADYVITGMADIAFATLCRAVLAGAAPSDRVIDGASPPLDQLVLPYSRYTDTDLAQRLVYVEASRGCPFKCEFCLSSLDKTAVPFALDRFLDAMAKLYDRGARNFKFVDRTFNLNVKTSLAILDFFLARMSPELFVHFEVIPDHLPDKLKEAILRFPPGSLQFEVGIQTLDPAVQGLISRKQDDAKMEANLRWLRDASPAHIHADLIVGLPGEDLASFARGFDRLYALGPHEIQVGILKRLRGTPIRRHTDAFAMRYNPDPPYDILSTDRISFADMRRMNRFARYWDLVANSGRFKDALPLLLGSTPCERFLAFSDWLFATTGKTHEFALDRLYDLMYRALTERFEISADVAREVLTRDYVGSGARGAPAFMNQHTHDNAATRVRALRTAERQSRHLREGTTPS